MNNLILSLAMTMLVVVAGCNQGTPGGPGTTGEQPSFGQAQNTFNLSVPMMSTSLQQGEQVETTVGIKRATNFDEDVTISFADVPQGVRVEPATPEIKRGRSDAKVKFIAEDDASLGDFIVKITGNPSEGSDALVEFKLKVTPKDSFTINAPNNSTIKQGETQTITIAITRDTKFNQDVTLTFSKLPTGVTLEPQSTVIKQGEARAEVTLTATEDAALGDFVIKVNANPAKGEAAADEFTLTVAKGDRTVDDSTTDDGASDL